jgi:hypothetical protein
MSELPQSIAAHRYSRAHRRELEASIRCGCFHCLAIFAPDAISEWIDEPVEGGETAICPRCGVDAVIGSASVNFTPELLEAMRREWFAKA